MQAEGSAQCRAGRTSRCTARRRPSMSKKIKLLTKIVGVVALCLSLTGCPLFCLCASFLVQRGPNYPDSFDWSSFLGNCGGEDYICPDKGEFGNPPTACVPGTLNPTDPSSLAPEAIAPPSSTPSSPAAEDVEAPLTS